MKERIIDVICVGGLGGWLVGLMELCCLWNVDIWMVWCIVSYDVKWYWLDDNRFDFVGLLVKVGIMINFVFYIFWYMYIK